MKFVSRSWLIPLALSGIVCALCHVTSTDAATVLAAGPTPEIKVDQVGYLSTAAKIALVSSHATATGFTLNQSKDGKKVFEGSLSAPAPDADSGDQVQTADFTRAVVKPGTYYIDVPGVGRSWNFEIGPD